MPVRQLLSEIGSLATMLKPCFLMSPLSVAQYLQELKVRESNCIFTQGKGAEIPVDSNSTEKGRARNRRVEITLMDE